MLEVDLGMMAVFYALRWFSKLRTSKVGVSVVVTIFIRIRFTKSSLLVAFYREPLGLPVEPPQKL